MDEPTRSKTRKNNNRNILYDEKKKLLSFDYIFIIFRLYKSMWNNKFPVIDSHANYPHLRVLNENVRF